jgi:glycine/D-amino acid oxidase-like deaminating enzyme
VRGWQDRLPERAGVRKQRGAQPAPGEHGWQARTEAGQVSATRVLACVGAFLPRVGVHQRHLPLELSASITRPLTEEHWQQRFGERTWGVLSSLPGGATLRLLPGRRLLIRNTVEYRCRDLGPAQLQARRREHLNGLQKRFPGLHAEDLEYTWTGHLSGTRSGEPCFARVAEGLYAVAGCNGSGSPAAPCGAGCWSRWPRAKPRRC